jgi:hypothetical protein
LKYKQEVIKRLKLQQQKAKHSTSFKHYEILIVICLLTNRYVSSYHFCSPLPWHLTVHYICCSKLLTERVLVEMMKSISTFRSHLSLTKINGIFVHTQKIIVLSVQEWFMTWTAHNSLIFLKNIFRRNRLSGPLVTNPCFYTVWSNKFLILEFFMWVVII